MEAVHVKVDKLADKDADSTESEVRYLAYGARLRTALRAGQRYIAYVCFHHLRMLASCSSINRLAMSAKLFVL